MAVARNKTETKVVYQPEERTYAQRQLDEFFNPTQRRQEPVMVGIKRGQTLQPNGGSNSKR